MDKKAIKSFAVNAREKLIDDAKYQAGLLGITENGINDPIESTKDMETYSLGGSATHTIYNEEIEQRESLVREINKKGYENVMEEVAYTWFNRIIAIRFMEVNNYLPAKTRVLSSENKDKIEPDIITEVFEIDLNLTNEEKNRIIKLKEENKSDELFQMLFIKQCNELNKNLPALFEKTNDFKELLLNISYINSEGVLRELVDTIPEEDFKNQVEIIGWLYQFYNSELKDRIFANLKKNVKISKENIPPATQIFTPHWIVKYMVENSLGRLWLEGNPDSNLKDNWKYYLDEANQSDETNKELIKIRKELKNLSIENIKVIDPCMGSGHILIYVFDVLMQIYVSLGYSERDATISIIKNNIYGLDIDDRAFQLTYFTLMMKGREFNRKFLKSNIMPNIASFNETNNISKDLINFIEKYDDEILDEMKIIIGKFIDGKNNGSLIDLPDYDFKSLYLKIEDIEKRIIEKLDLKNEKFKLELLKNILTQCIILNQKYDIVVTNPPYMGQKGMNNELKDYVKNNYSLSKSDLFSTFIEKGLEMTKEYGYSSMVTMQSWMFLGSFEKLRKKLLSQAYISNLLHMDNMVMGIAFGTAVSIFRRMDLPGYVGNYNHVKLEDVNKEIGEPYSFPVQGNRNNQINTQSFDIIPGSPIAYWADKRLLNTFVKYHSLENFAKPSRGLATFNDNKFLRYWFEVSFDSINFNCTNLEESVNSKNKWFPYNKGGEYRKWYGNNEFIVNFFNMGSDIKETGKGSFSNMDSYFKKGLTWSRISSTNFGVRFHNNGFIIGDAGPSVIVNDNDNIYYILGILLSQYSFEILKLLNSTLTFQVGDLNKIPVHIDDSIKKDVNSLVKQNISLEKQDWDDTEISWDFRSNFLIKNCSNYDLISEGYLDYVKYKEKQFDSIKNNEMELNNLLSASYGIQHSKNISDKDITINTNNSKNFIKSFISYAVGCMFGRYSLDQEGLAFAGGDFNLNNYQTFIPDDDNIIPITDNEYFEDDIVNRFIEFVKVTFGEENLEINLDFIANALNEKGKNSRKVIRDYFLKEFYKDHVKLYKKRPIYWQFDSGKQNGFKCLIYMHRYEPSLVARIRTDYLHKTQKAYEDNIKNAENIIINTESKTDKKRATKEKNKMLKQLDETRKYDEALAHIANQNINIDLDDGVKANYEKFQEVKIQKEGQKNKKINLLKKI